ncbi:MAG: hypothetical protein Rubg2KO_17550 [Rubricoccaceae bacterium]
MRGFLLTPILSVFVLPWGLPVPEGTEDLMTSDYSFVQRVQDEEQKLIASDASGTDNFGFSVALSGDRALVGAHLVGTNGEFQSGAAYVFERVDGAWVETATLTAPDAARSDNFGTSVALDGDRAFVGATATAIRPGAVYVFDWAAGSWTLSQKLTAPDAQPGDEFGISVSLDGDRALIGAHQNGTETNTREGAAYVFDLAGGTWTQTQKLTATDAAVGDGFGISVSLDEDRALIGASRGEPNDNGSAYVFDLVSGSWSETQKLSARNTMPLDYFGISVSLDGDRALIGAYGDDPGEGGNYGSAYVFDFSSGTWSETTKLTATDGESTDWFGFAVALDGGRALVGDWADNTDRGDRVGSAYVFDLVDGRWSESVYLEASDALQGEQLGISVALDGNRALVGANSADIGIEINAGAAYSYTLPDPVANEDAADRAVTLTVAPNPVASHGTVTLELTEAADVTVALYDALGREVAQLAEGPYSAGRHSLALATDDLPVGVYVIRAQLGNTVCTTRLTVVR